MPRLNRVPAVGRVGRTGRHLYYCPWTPPWKTLGPSGYRQFIKRRKRKLDRLAAKQDPEVDTSTHYRGYED